MNEFHENLWAPWRLDYVQGLADDKRPPCFLCDYAAQPNDDASNLVVARRESAFIIMNRFPYTNGHLLIAPLAHKADLVDLSDDEMTHLWHLTRDAKSLLAKVLKPDGFNIGINFGRCAGAGLPGHLHIHIVPRWSGDTNFMSVAGDVRVIPQALDKLCTLLRAASQ
ncbi:MAG: HIT domain-containing protein [Planctomycetes bacterium]|nr:HIT domain-containing protein [Planctomycetota bacterium]